MRPWSFLLGTLAACTFSPTRGEQGPPVDAPPSTGSGSGSGPGSTPGPCPDGDSDGDGICNGADDWPCGAKPNPPGNFNVITLGFSMADDNVALAEQRVTLLVVHPGQPFRVDFHYDVTVPCPTGQTCDVQLELGTEAGKQGCGDSFLVKGQQVGFLQLGNAKGSASLDLTLATAGVHKILTQPNKAEACGDSAWAGNGSPDDRLTVGLVCVHP